MKQLILASVIALASSLSYANPTDTVNNPREKAEQLYLAQDYKASFKEFKRLAKTGDGQAIYNLGVMTKEGKGTKQSNAKALKYYKKAAQTGYARAEMALFDIYQLGELGIKPNPTEALQHLEKASQLGYTDATVELANQYFSVGDQEHDQKAIALLQPLAQQNHMPAMHLLAVYNLINGVKTVNENAIMTGLKGLETLTKQGYIPSMMAVANMYATGEVLPQNLEMAQNLYIILVQNNVPTARERLEQVQNALREQNAKIQQQNQQVAPKK